MARTFSRRNNGSGGPKLLDIDNALLMRYLAIEVPIKNNTLQADLVFMDILLIVKIRYNKVPHLLVVKQ